MTFLSFWFRWPNLPCLRKRESERDIATNCRPSPWPKRLRHYLGYTVQRLFCLDQQLEDRFYIPWQRKLAVIYPMITISENIWSAWISFQTCKRASTLRLVSAAFHSYLKDSRIGGYLDLSLPLQDFLLLRYLHVRIHARKVLTSWSTWARVYIFEDFGIFFQISSRVSRLNFLLFLNTHISSLKYSAGLAQMSSTTSIFFLHNYCE